MITRAIAELRGARADCLLGAFGVVVCRFCGSELANALKPLVLDLECEYCGARVVELERRGPPDSEGSLDGKQLSKSWREPKAPREPLEAGDVVPSCAECGRPLPQCNCPERADLVGDPPVI